MTDAERRALYLMLRHDDEGGSNRGREFYDGQCQSCESEYETHEDECQFMAALIALGGDEERERQRKRRVDRDELRRGTHSHEAAR
jgi:hypothetical protein